MALEGKEENVLFNDVCFFIYGYMALDHDHTDSE